MDVISLSYCCGERPECLETAKIKIKTGREGEGERTHWHLGLMGKELTPGVSILCQICSWNLEQREDTRANSSALSHEALSDSTNIFLDRKIFLPCSILKIACLFRTENYTQSFLVI